MLSVETVFDREGVLIFEMKCKRTCGLCLYCDLTECYASYPAQYKCTKTGYLHTFDHECDVEELKDVD